jgi:hypothetical protein
MGAKLRVQHVKNVRCDGERCAVRDVKDLCRSKDKRETHRGQCVDRSDLEPVYQELKEQHGPI